MKVIIAGSRGIDNYDLIETVIMSFLNPSKIIEVVSGGARGVDLAGELFAAKFGIPVKVFYPNWKEHGRYAGHLRNKQMAEYADALIAVWDGKSAGTRNMIEQAEKRGLKVYVHTP